MSSSNSNDLLMLEEVIQDVTKREKKEKQRRHRPATLKQIKALQYINQGFSKRQAMIKAGYSAKTAASPSIHLMNKVGVKDILYGMAGDLVDAGLTKEFITLKIKEWFEAQKVDHSHTGPDTLVPDYDTQIKAYDRWEKIMEQQINPEKKVKRKLTIEEFVTGEEEKVG